MAGTGRLALRDYHGGIWIENYNGTEGHSLDISAGSVVFDSASVLSGTFVLRGTGSLRDENGNFIESGMFNSAVVINEFLSLAKVAEVVWDSPASGHAVPDSFGWLMQQLLTLKKWIGLR